MKKLALLIAVPAALVAALVTSSAKRTYHGDYLTIHEVTAREDGTIQIAFSTLIETMWFCPGADAVETPDGIVIRFLRVGFKERPEVDYPATAAEIDGRIAQTITLPAGTRAVFYQNGDERQELLPAKE